MKRCWVMAIWSFSHCDRRTDPGYWRPQGILYSVQCCYAVHWTDNKWLYPYNPNISTRLKYLPRDATQSAVMCHSRPLSSVHPSVRPSVRDVQVPYHIGWNTSKIISRLNSLRYLLKLTPQHRRSGRTGTPPKQGGIGVGQEHKKLNYLRNGARQD